VSNVNLQAVPFVFRGHWSDIFSLTSFSSLTSSYQEIPFVVSGNIDLLSYADNEGTCNHSWLSFRKGKEQWL